MPHKLNDAHREKFPKAKYRVTSNCSPPSLNRGLPEGNLGIDTRPGS